jgi:hypothetical protein
MKRTSYLENILGQPCPPNEGQVKRSTEAYLFRVNNEPFISDLDTKTMSKMKYMDGVLGEGSFGRVYLAKFTHREKEGTFNIVVKVFADPRCWIQELRVLSMIKYFPSYQISAFFLVNHHLY